MTDKDVEATSEDDACMEVVIHNLAGEIVTTLACQPHDTVGSLKQRLCEITHTPLSHKKLLQLLLSGKALLDEFTLEANDVTGVEPLVKGKQNKRQTKEQKRTGRKEKKQTKTRLKKTTNKTDKQNRKQSNKNDKRQAKTTTTYFPAEQQAKPFSSSFFSAAAACSTIKKSILLTLMSGSCIFTH